ncbi:gamma-glutamyl AIG2-like cyclotransferase [Kushneria sinocarnis]|uniref:Gamma-glutamyl AIG2-like cyclotransferase n=1 Tax=Kushneria sinocarnis TaxID=595502 RepID=A0A420WTT9_9GAMM|nr:gamma-glutamylcyclotransferase family protein [Kushneria sinocarnis]RKQ96321.1 gamma-glutamyl AIG2-like cyclotransferase [Kushneria sinocarnis]
MSAVHYYFAYGSNMNPARMQARVGETRGALAARLPGWRLSFDKAARPAGVAHANVAPDERAVVEGVLHELAHPEQIELMDPYEGHPDQYQRRIESFETEHGMLSGWVYVALSDKTEAGRLPAREYMAHLLAGRPWLSRAYYEALLQQPCIDGLDQKVLQDIGIRQQTPR